MEKTDAKPEVTAQAAAPAPVQVSPAQGYGPVGDQADTKSRLAMMLLAFFAVPTGLARAYIGDKNGMTRFWVYLGCSIAMVVPFLNILTGIVLLVLTVWGIVDFFSLTKVYTDAFGMQLSSTNRDERVIRYLRTIMIVVLVFYAVMFLLALIMIPVMMSMANDVTNIYRFKY